MLRKRYKTGNGVIREEVAMKAARATKGGADADGCGYVKGIVAVVATVRTAVTGGGKGGLRRRHDGLLVSSCSIFSRHTVYFLTFSLFYFRRTVEKTFYLNCFVHEPVEL